MTILYFRVFILKLGEHQSIKRAQHEDLKKPFCLDVPVKYLKALFMKMSWFSCSSVKDSKIQTLDLLSPSLSAGSGRTWSHLTVCFGGVVFNTRSNYTHVRICSLISYYWMSPHRRNELYLLDLQALLLCHLIWLLRTVQSLFSDEYLCHLKEEARARFADSFKCQRMDFSLISQTGFVPS